jgi:hypothetical protein
LLSTFSVSAESDGTNDVWHQVWSEVDQSYSWEAYSGTKNNIDITDVSYSIQGTTATVTMTTVGDMTDTENVVYTMHLKSGETSYYMIMYTNGQGSVLGFGDFTGTVSQLENPISGNTFTASFEVSDPDAQYTLYGFNAEHTDIDAEHGEAWWDYAPNTYAPWYSAGDGDGDGDGDGNGNGGNGDNGGNGSSGTPGFEAIILIAAIGIALIIIRRK